MCHNFCVPKAHFWSILYTLISSQINVSFQVFFWGFFSNHFHFRFVFLFVFCSIELSKFDIMFKFVSVSALQFQI